MRPAIFVPLLALTLSTTACGIREKIEQRVSEEVAEKVIEVAAGGEVDVETKDGKVSISGKDGQKIEVDTEKGTTKITDEQGKTYDYAQAEDGSATVKGSDGLDAQVGAEIPSDFPIMLPAAKLVAMGSSVKSPDGAHSFAVNYQAVATDLAEVEKALNTALAGQGLTVERNEMTTPDTKMVTLGGKSSDAKIEVVVMLATSPEAPHVNVVVSWSDRSGVAE